MLTQTEQQDVKLVHQILKNLTVRLKVHLGAGLIRIADLFERTAAFAALIALIINVLAV